MIVNVLPDGGAVVEVVQDGLPNIVEVVNSSAPSIVEVIQDNLPNVVEVFELSTSYNVEVLQDSLPKVVEVFQSATPNVVEVITAGPMGPPGPGGAGYIDTGSLVTTASFNSYTGSHISQFAGTASYATTARNILGGKVNHIPFFKTDTTLATSSIYQSGSYSIIINQDSNTPDNPEALYVWQPHPTSFNIISGKGNLNNYAQLNVFNTNTGDNASSDIVATADNGNETTNFIDMGINGSGFTGEIGNANDAYLYSAGQHLHIGNTNPTKPIQFFVGGADSDLYRKFELNANGQHNMTGSLEISGSLVVQNATITGSLSTTGSNKLIGNTSLTGSLNVSGSTLQVGNNTLVGNTVLSGSILISGSSTIKGTTTMTGSLLITGSTIQIGNNTLLGNTVLSGSILISGSVAPGNLSASVNIYGDTAMTGYLKFNPYSTNIDTSISASYMFVSGSTNDLYFSQNTKGYSNITRLRWLEGNLYTGLLHGGVLSISSSTVFNVSSGSGIIVTLNGSYNDDPYPTVQYVNWGNMSASIAPLSSSADWSFIAINSSSAIEVKGTPYEDGEYNTKIPLGLVLHQNRLTINGVQTFPSLAYGWKQRSFDFMKAFGPLKISGYGLSPSGSSTGELFLAGGVSWVDGRNYTINPNNPSYITEAVGISTSKIFRYHQSGSQWVYDTNGGVGYTSIDPSQYSLNGILTPVPTNDFTIQRVYYFPNSATKALFVYYGNDHYSNKEVAKAAIGVESFAEAPNTAANAIFIGYMLLRHNADFTVAASYDIQSAGLFRAAGGAGGGGGGGTTTPGGLTTQIQYNNAGAFGGVPNLTWDGTTLRATGSLQGTASYAVTASYALNGGGGGGGPAFPYTGSALITGSLGVTGSVSIKGTEVEVTTGATRGTTTTYTKLDYATTQDNIDTNMALKRDSNGGIYNPYYEPYYNQATSLSPLYTEWNSRFTDAVNYGFDNLVNAKSRTYSTWKLAVNNNAAWYLPTDQDTYQPLELIMHDLINDKYYSFTFTQWTAGGAGGGMSYDRELINFTTQTTYPGNILDVKGSTLLTGSLNVSQGITGSLLGTSSQAVSSSYTVTASYALNAGAGSGFPYSGSAVITGSLLVSGSGLTVTGSVRVSGSITGSLFGTASNAQTASFALSSSNFVIANTLRLDNTLTDYRTATSITSETLNLFQQATGSYTSAFVKYSILNGNNARAGEFITVWNGTTIVNYDNSTTDIGNTAAVTFNSSIVSSQIQINAVVTAGWTIKALATFI